MNSSLCLFSSARQQCSAWGSPPCTKVQDTPPARNACAGPLFPFSLGPVLCHLLSQSESSRLIYFVLLSSFTVGGQVPYSFVARSQNLSFLFLPLCASVWIVSVAVSSSSLMFSSALSSLALISSVFFVCFVLFFKDCSFYL